MIIIVVGLVVGYSVPTLIDKYYNSYDQNAVKEKLKKMVPNATSVKLTSKNHITPDLWTVKYPDGAWIYFYYSHGKLTTDSVVYICACK